MMTSNQSEFRFGEGEGTKKKTILPLTEKSLLKKLANTRLVKFNLKLPENKTTLARDAEKSNVTLVSRVSG
jgi:hypothetical protein